MAAFNVYSLDSPQVARTIRQKLEKIRAERASFIADGTATDWPDYKRRVGVLEGIDVALRVCDELEQEAEGRR